MKKILTTGVLFLGWSISARAADFSRCQLNAPNYPLPYGIGADGKLKRPPKDPDLSSYSNANGEEVAVVKTHPNMMGNVKMVYALHSEHGKPVSYSQKIGPSEMRYTLGYDGENCFVAETSVKMEDPKTKKASESVTYNKEMCDQIIQAADKLTDSKIQECAAVFGTVEMVRNQFQNKFSAQGRSLASPMSGMYFPMQSTAASAGVPSAVDMITGCKGSRYFYPVNGIKPSAPAMGGGIFGAGGDASNGGYGGGGIMGAPAPNGGFPSDNGGEPGTTTVK